MWVRPSQAFAIVWIGWIVSWLLAAFWSARTQARPASWSASVYRVVLLAGAILLLPAVARKLAEQRLWHVGYDGADGLAAITLAGVLFTWWARIYLGRLWSGSITRKEGHRIITGGPYALVRHPIYTGLIAAIAATAAAQATITALLGAAIVTFGMWLKAREEERFLIAELGADAYASYRRSVPMLVPFLPHRH